MSTDSCLDAALDYVRRVHNAKYTGLLPRALYIHLRINGHMELPVFRSTALPSFPRSTNQPNTLAK